MITLEEKSRVSVIKIKQFLLKSYINVNRIIRLERNDELQV